MTAASSHPEDIVIIGFAAHLPQVEDLTSWWHGLREGTEFAHVSTDDELLRDGLPPDMLNHPDLVRRRPVIEDAEHFDPELFGYSPREASECDPQQRLFLEVCWRLFEHSGHDPFRDGSACGVFAAAGPAQYLRGGSAYDVGTHFATVVGNERDFISPRVAYKLDLTGPALSITSGCASSLVAIHLAVQSLQAHETDLAIAGGSTIFFPQKGGYLHSPDHINSPDGRCRAFSAEANGTVHADGVGAVLLRRRADAEADGDTIWGVVLGTAVTNDGADKMGFTAPSVIGESRAIAEALAVASLQPDDIDYVETHGTATALGDAVEVEAINSALAGASAGSILLGALKPNIGHTDTAAGVLGVIKTLLALHHQELPPVAALERVNPDLDLTGPCRVNTMVTPWPRTARPRRAGVSAFSIGGTNAHVIIEEPPASPDRRFKDRPETFWLRFSAHTETALDETMTALADHLDSVQPDLVDVRHTLSNGRAQLRHRRVVEVHEDDAAAIIRDAIRTPATDAAPRPIVLAFPGQGSQFLSMAGELRATSPTFADVVKRCAEITRRTTGVEILPLLNSGATSELEDRLINTDHTQPALFAVQVGLLAMLKEWGVVPDCLIGHSLGEYAAAVSAGVWSLDEAAKAVAHRGRLLAESREGAMAAATADPQQVRSLCPGIGIAAVNGPAQTVITGSPEEIGAAVDVLRANGVRCQQVRVNRAFHSHLVDEASRRLGSMLQGTSMAQPLIPLAWASTAAWMDRRTTAEDWGRQLRDAVLFADTVALVHERSPKAIWVEVGPGRVLSDLVQQIRPGTPTLALLPREVGTTAASLAARVWQHGLAPAVLDLGSACRIPLPGVAMQRRLLSGARGVIAEGTTAPSAVPEAPRGEDPLAVVLQVWKEELGVADPTPDVDFFELGGDSVLAARVAARLRQRYPVPISPVDVMQDPSTPASLVERITELLTSHIDSLSDDQVAALLEAEH